MTKKIGILGGVGPLATVYFMELLTLRTFAEKDQDHPDVICLNFGSVPDRTAYILGESKDSPVPVLNRNAKMLEKMGADFLVMPCNTGHYFYDEIMEGVSIPMIHLIEAVTDEAKKRGTTRLGFLGTEGSLHTGLYRTFCEKQDIAYLTPDPPVQKEVMHLIYDQVKAGHPMDFDLYDRVIDHMRNKGCDIIVLGCTELSVFHAEHPQKADDILDSLEVLAERTIVAAGKKLK